MNSRDGVLGKFNHARNTAALLVLPPVLTAIVSGQLHDALLKIIERLILVGRDLL